MPDLTRGRRLLVLGICCTSVFIATLDNTIVNVALPALRSDLHTTVSGLQWTIDAYTLVLASLFTLAGSAADRVGRRRTFQTGLAVFALGSLLCSLAPSLAWLVAFRMVQGVGGSMLNPVALSIIANTFTDVGERARAIGVWSGVVGISMALGPVLGGALVDTAGWRSIFWINVPVAVAALVLAALFVPESRAPRPRRLDLVGQVLVLAMLASLTYGIIEGPNVGWTSPEIVAFFTVAAAALAGLLVYEPRRREPLLELRFFRSAPFSGATLLAVSAFAAMAGFLFLNTLYLQDVRGFPPLQAGLYMVPVAAVAVVFAPLSGRLIGSRGPRVPLVIAGVCMTAGALLLTGLAVDTPLGWLFAAYVLFGVGFAMVNPPITTNAVSGMPSAQAGVAAAIAATSRQVGTSLGVAIVGSVVVSRLRGPLDAGFAPASRAGWWIIAGCGMVVLVVGVVTSGRWGRATAARVAAGVGEQTPKVEVATP